MSHIYDRVAISKEIPKFPAGACFTNIVDRQMYRQKFHRQIGECGENFVLPFIIKLFGASS